MKDHYTENHKTLRRETERRSRCWHKRMLSSSSPEKTSRIHLHVEKFSLGNKRETGRRTLQPRLQRKITCSQMETEQKSSGWDPCRYEKTQVRGAIVGSEILAGE